MRGITYFYAKRKGEAYKPLVLCVVHWAVGLLSSLLLDWIGFTLFLFAVSQRTLDAKIKKMLYKCWLALKETLFIWKEEVVGKRRTFVKNNLFKKIVKWCLAQKKSCTRMCLKTILHSSICISQFWDNVKIFPGLVFGTICWDGVELH